MVVVSLPVFSISKDNFGEALVAYRRVLDERPSTFPDLLTQLYKQLLTNFENKHLRLLIAELYFYLSDYSGVMEEIEDILESDHKARYL